MGILSTDNYVPILKSLVHLINKKANITRVDELESSVTTTFNEHNVASDAHADLFEAKQDTLTFDSTPTEGSENPVTSDGIAKYVTWENLPDKPFGEKSVVEVKLNKEPLVYEQHRDHYTVHVGVDYPRYPVAGNEYIIEVNNERYECLAMDDGYGDVCFGDIRVKNGNDEYTVPFYFMVCPQINDDTDTSFTHAKAGVYTVNIIEVVEKTTAIPSEMLPEGYPYWEVKEKVLVEETNVTTSDTGNGIFAQNPFAIFLQSGQKYTVIWDGTPYECLCKDVGGAGGAYIGNGSLAGMEADTGEPFFVGISGNGSFVYTATAGTYTVSIVTIEETLVTIDEKYLPDTIATTTYVDTAASILKPITTEGDGTAYTATVSGITSLTVGTTITIIPHVVSASTTPTLDVNGLGAKQIRRRLSSIATAPTTGYSNTWLAKGKPFTVKYDGTYWVVEGLTKPVASDITAGTLGGQVVANADAQADLTVSQVRNIYAGTTDLVAGTSELTTGAIYLVYEP